MKHLWLTAITLVSAVVLTAAPALAYPSPEEELVSLIMDEKAKALKNGDVADQFEAIHPEIADFIRRAQSGGVIFHIDAEETSDTDERGAGSIAEEMPGDDPEEIHYTVTWDPAGKITVKNDMTNDPASQYDSHGSLFGMPEVNGLPMIMNTCALSEKVSEEALYTFLEECEVTKEEGTYERIIWNENAVDTESALSDTEEVYFTEGGDETETVPCSIYRVNISPENFVRYVKDFSEGFRKYKLFTQKNYSWSWIADMLDDHVEREFGTSDQPVEWLVYVTEQGIEEIVFGSDMEEADRDYLTEKDSFSSIVETETPEEVMEDTFPSLFCSSMDFGAASPDEAEDEGFIFNSWISIEQESDREAVSLSNSFDCYRDEDVWSESDDIKISRVFYDKVTGTGCSFFQMTGMEEETTWYSWTMSVQEGDDVHLVDIICSGFEIEDGLLKMDLEMTRSALGSVSTEADEFTDIELYNVQLEGTMEMILPASED